MTDPELPGNPDAPMVDPVAGEDGQGTPGLPPSLPTTPATVEECAPDGADITQFAALPATRRLSARQYVFAMQELAGDPSLELTVDSDPAPEGNFELPSNLGVTRQWVENAEQNSWVVAPKLLARVTATLGCEPAGDAACLNSMMDSLALQVWRRPLEAEERTRLEAFRAEIEQQVGAAEVPEAIVSAFLQAPQFAHRDDVPRGEVIAPGLRRIDDWQYAEALAIFLWRSLPDAELLDAAANGSLSDPQLAKAQVERMLDHPNATRITSHFADQWLNIARLEVTNKDEGDWSEALAQATRRDTNEVFAHLMRDPTTTIADLLTHNTAFVTPENADLFGMTMEADEPGRLVELTPEQRSGILTHNSFLTTHSKVQGTSAIRRGDMVLRQMLCQHLVLPADLVIPEEPKDDAAPTERERLAIHRDSPACSGCHSLMDPPGLALELWDGVGRARTTENGVQIDASGTLILPESGAQDFETPQQMFELLASSPRLESCFLERWYNEATGTANRLDKEVCGLGDITNKIRNESGIPLRTLLSELTLHPSFWLRKEIVQ